jgi:streptogramin lyase
MGPDGNLSFTDSSSAGSAIGGITPAGAITEFPLPTPIGVPGPMLPGPLTVGPDGNLWFPEYSGNFSIYSPPSFSEIGRITTAGALTEFPTIEGSPGSLTVGPDGNLWFILDTGYFPNQMGEIARITTSGALATFPFPAGYSDRSGLTMGPDGNLWFTEVSSAESGVAIGRIDVTGPRVTSVIAVAHSSKAITSILIGFDEALEPASAKVVRFYSVAPGVEKGHRLVFRKGVKIRRVLYDVTAQTVRLKLAVPQKRPVRVTVRAGFVAADGMASTGDFTAVVE